jgi:hypothetical protein
MVNGKGVMDSHAGSSTIPSNRTGSFSRGRSMGWTAGVAKAVKEKNAVKKDNETIRLVAFTTSVVDLNIKKPEDVFCIGFLLGVV